MMTKVLKVHDTDPNFPVLVLQKIREFVENENIFKHPENHSAIIYEMKMEAALIMGNSPYAEVRAVVDNTDDVTMPSSTIRAWVCKSQDSFPPLLVLRLWECLFAPQLYVTDNTKTYR
jgi:hypothetical protein